MASITLISYSYTGNNEALATSVASALTAQHIRITESGSRTMATIAADILLGRTPKVSPSVEDIDTSGFVIFMGPVWMGKAATPLRACFRELRDTIGRYAFVSLCGGTDGTNPKLAEDVQKRLSKKPEIVVELHITDLLPADPKPTRDDVSAYKLTDKDLTELTSKTVKALEQALQR